MCINLIFLHSSRGHPHNVVHVPEDLPGRGRKGILPRPRPQLPEGGAGCLDIVRRV